MDGYNKVILMGTVGKDPELRIINEQSRVASFSLATNRSWKDASGQRKEVAEWHKVEVWNAKADFVNAHVKLGKHLMIEGEIRYENFLDKEGKKVYITKIAAQNIQFVLGPNVNGQNGQRQQPAQQQPVQQQPVQQQPVQQQPVQQQPVQQQPVVQEAQQQVNNYQNQPQGQPVTDSQLVNQMNNGGGNSPDDLPF